MILVSAASAMLLVSPLAVQAATTKAPASTSAKASCKGLKGAALKDCRAKLHATAKPAAKAK
jgi:hypothetical protein